MDRPHLALLDPRLESLWRAGRDAVGRRAWDAFLTCAALASAKALQMQAKRALLPQLACPLLCALCCASVAFLRHAPAAKTRWRDAVVGSLKLAVAAALCSLVATGEGPAADAWPQFARFELLLLQRALVVGGLALALPQPLLCHCMVQSCVVLLLLLASPSACTAAHARQPADYSRYQQVVAWLDRALLPSAAPRERACPLAECGQVYCMHVQALLSIGIGFVLPTLAIHALERHSRRALLLRQLAASGKAQPPVRKLGRQTAWLLVYLANLSLGAALLWHWLGWLYALRVGAYALRPAA